uniref:Sulfatase n=1 Tax=Rhipicephalus pulchellus TaxID=72859 RepID=L7LZ52_RHIPC
MRRRRSLQLLGWLLLAAMATLALLGAPPWPSGGDYSSSAPAELTRHPFWMYDPVVQEPRDARQLCSLPVVHPLHPSVWPYLKRTVPIQCKVRQPWLTFVDNRGNLRFNDSSGYKLDSLRCTYTPAERDGDDKVIYGDPVPFTRDKTPLQHDVVYVSCRNYFEIPVYSNVHAVLRMPKSMVTSPPPKATNRPNVLVFGLDSISRLSMMRLLPKTYTFLTDVLGSVVFRGMNKVGDNTFPNLVALLTGMEAYTQLEHPGTNGDTFDDVRFIWKDFKRDGYLTLFAEDFPEYGVFNYLARGFRDPPTDFYFRPYCLAMENSFLMRSSSNLCYGNVPKHVLQIDYVRRFIEVNNGSRPYFAFSFLVEISHEYMQQVAAADEDILQFLTEIRDRGHLDNTFLFFLSDHGHRFDSIRETFVGRLEERLPFFAVRPPSRSPWPKHDSATRRGSATSDSGSAVSFLAESTTVTSASLLKALQSNAGRLTTPYDTYETFRDILSLGRHGSFTDKWRSDFGISLFREIPLSRTCDLAKVPEQYCSCDAEEPIEVSSKIVEKAALALVDKVNNLLEVGLGNASYRCARLTIRKIQDAREVFSSIGSSSSSSSPTRANESSHPANVVGHKSAADVGRHSANVRRIRVTVIVHPSDAMLEGLLLVREDQRLVVFDDVSRINKYGRQSSCIEHQTLRKYCYCI